MLFYQVFFFSVIVLICRNFLFCMVIAEFVPSKIGWMVPRIKLQRKSFVILHKSRSLACDNFVYYENGWQLFFDYSHDVSRNFPVQLCLPTVVVLAFFWLQMVSCKMTNPPLQWVLLLSLASLANQAKPTHPITVKLFKLLLRSKHYSLKKIIFLYYFDILILKIKKILF
jgi:hypothetical protein